MATARAAGDELRRELICPICLDYFKDPVILKCGHNFCRVCICTHWNENGGNYGYRCPQCRAEFNTRSFTKNFVVQNLVSRLDDLDCFGSSATQSNTRPKCDVHKEELKLYCRTDKMPICIVCWESWMHRRHQVAPVSEVMNEMKVDLKLRLTELNSQKTKFLKVKNADALTKSEIRLKKLRLKEKIEADFGPLVQFLLEERDSLIDQLDAEEVAAIAIIDDNLKTVNSEVEVVERTIANIDSQLSGKTSIENLTDAFSELLNCKCLSTPEPVNCPTDFTDFSGPFQLITWKKMMHVLHTMPQNLTLDPDTAYPNLVISDFDTKVEEGYCRGQELDQPTRFNRFCGVLATAQYTSGQHYWEVDVKDKGVWYLGVTTESSNRKGFVNLCPSSGYWSLCLQDRLFVNGEHGRISVADYWNSPRVGVYLDYDNGRLSFYDAVTMKRLYMFNTCFQEAVYPFFSPGKHDPGSRLQICHYY